MDETAYQIGVSWNEDILEIAITGQALKQNARKIALDIFKVFSEHRPGKVLINCTKVVGRLSTTDTYFHVRQYPSEHHQPTRLAVVDLPENESASSFQELAAANVGYPLKFFTDIDKAVKWLRE